MAEQSNSPPGSINALLVARQLRKEKIGGTLVWRILDADGREVFRGGTCDVGQWLEAGCPPAETEPVR